MLCVWNVSIIESMHDLENVSSPGGDMYESSQAFLVRAASYDDGGLDIRSRRLHDQWLSTLPCPILCFEGAYTIEEHLAVLMVEIQR